MQDPASLDHLIALTDDVGVIQHATEEIPNRSTGYCVDDVGRALIVALSASRYPALAREANRLGRIYLSYLHDAQRPDGRMRNFMGYDRRWLDDVGSEDSFGRGMWGLGYAARHAGKPGWRNLSTAILIRAVPHLDELTHFRSRSYAALGFTLAYDALAQVHAELLPKLKRIADDLVASFAAHSDSKWAWFEPFMTYDNARLSEAALRLGVMLRRPDLLEIGYRSLDFYASVVIEDGVFVPIGNREWYYRGAERSRFDQQPLEAAGLIDAALFAYDLTGSARYLRLAELAYDWFFGRNSINAPLVVDGGCRDGLSPHGVNRNMGSESTIAYLCSAFTLSPYLIRRSASGAVGRS